MGQFNHSATPDLLTASPSGDSAAGRFDHQLRKHSQSRSCRQPGHSWKYCLWRNDARCCAACEATNRSTRCRSTDDGRRRDGKSLPNTSVAGSPVPVPYASTQNPLSPPLAPTANYQVASSSVYGTGTGTNRVVNNDYSTTPYNDQGDPTRVGLSDASQIRPPTSTGGYPVDPRYAQSSVPGMYAPTYGAAPAKPTMQGQKVVQGQFNGSGAVGTGYAQAPPSTTTDPNRQAGWQDGSSYNR